ncbi:MAG TPA: hypothetical protein VLG68_05245 [Gammaproteobacteria bacterium]|nr:hypothetical protein [Gammaproteobacteria bacterium]
MIRRRTAFAACLAFALMAAGATNAAPAKKHAAKPASTSQARPAATRSVPSPAATIPTAAPAAATAPTPDPNFLSLDVVSGMAAAGAPQTALRLMDREQPDFSKDPVGWMSWERARIFVYQGSKHWNTVVQRDQKLPAEASPDFRAWEDLQAADAWLHLGDAAKTRALLEPLLWGDAAPDDKTLAAARQLIIRSYLADRRLDDAQAAVIRYRQDYPKDAGNWPLLEARLFLRTDQPQAALDVLEDVRGAEADMLALLASLRAGALKPADALAQAVKIGSDSKAPGEERVRAWVIAAEAADDLKNPAARIAALQDGLGLESGELDADDIFTLNPGMLWDAYIAYGQDLGNELQLVVGDDAAWFVAASNRFDTDPVRACALFSVVAYHAQDKQQVQVAHWQFASLIHRQANGDTVLRHLYLDSNRFKDVKSIPADVRYLLADAVLELPDIPLASQLMQGLDTPPPDTDPAAWQLQRARVFILGGNLDAGVAALQTLQVADAKLDPDALLPVLFDLQTLGHDKEAIPFFEALLGTELAPEQRRQLLYWTADSYKALGKYSKAAELYLRSALLTDPFSMDPWAQTARYQAAQMLGKAGYIDDARNLYHGLMNATRDPARQAVLQHDLQQLLLMPAKHGAEAAQD